MRYEVCIYKHLNSKTGVVYDYANSLEEAIDIGANMREEKYNFFAVYDTVLDRYIPLGL